MNLDELRAEHAKACIIEQCAADPKAAKAASDKADRLNRRIRQKEAFLRMQGFLDAAKSAEEYEDAKAAYIRFEDARLDWLRISHELLDAGLKALASA
jgi:hypothetical protein